MKYYPMRNDRENDDGANVQFVHKSASLDKILSGLSVPGKVCAKEFEMRATLKCWPRGSLSHIPS
jgi:hypothetical protein